MTDSVYMNELFQLSHNVPVSVIRQNVIYRHITVRNNKKSCKF